MSNRNNMKQEKSDEPNENNFIGIFILFILFFVSFFVYNAIFFNLFDLNRSILKTEKLYQNNFTENVDPNRQKLTLFDHNSRLCLILIDAMRYDFIFEIDNDKEKIRMPFVNRLMKEKKAIPFKLIANPPTVTLPRLKALVSGIIPEFIDILWNFNTTHLFEDNILKKFKQANKSIVFYGDDTWLKLFDPREYFLRYEGTTSFIASDYDEVDFNVTRHLDKELKLDDWRLMILHYLGLDHVGHIEGPYAPVNIRRKLFEMDGVIKKIFTALNENDLLIVLSDHGMANEGGHGGSSHMELTTPVLFISKKLFNKNEYTYLDGNEWIDWMNNFKSFKQIDLVSTISCLFNLNVPDQNKGVTFINYLIEYMNLNQSIDLELFAFNCLRDNFLQLNNHLGLIEHDEILRSEFYKMIKNQEQSSINSNKNFENLIKTSVNTKLKSQSNNKDQNLYLIVSILIIFTIFCYSISLFYNVNLIETGYFKWSNLLIPLINGLLVYFFLIQNENILSAKNISIQIIAFLFVIKLQGLFKKEFLSKIIINLNSANILKKFYVFAIIMHLFSLLSSSFIEEEHQIWYFIGTTQIYLILYLLVKAKTHQQSSISKLRLVIYFVLILATTRILRSINQTGNKWIHLKDIGDILKENPSKIPLILIVGLALTLVFFLKRKENKLLSVTLTLIYVYHISGCFELLKLYNRNLVAQASYVLLGLNLFIELTLFYKEIKLNNESKKTIYMLKQLETFCEILANNWIYFNCLIQPTHNLIVVSLWKLKEVLLNTVLNDNKKILLVFMSRQNILYLHIVISWLCFFAQGNSNSLNTIQISSGLVGINELNEILVGILIISATYSSNIYWFLIMVKNISLFEFEKRSESDKQNKDDIIKRDFKADLVTEVSKFIILVDMPTVSIYALNTFFQKEHLFVWSVFAPKLIYMLSYLLVKVSLLCFLTFMILILNV